MQTALSPDEVSPTIPELHIRLSLNRGRKDQIPGSVDKSPRMEHHLRWDEGQHLKVYDKPEPEVTPETEVASAGCLVGGSLGMRNFVNVRVHQTSL